MRKTLIVGATSAIAQATAKRLAQAGDALFLVARNEQKLSAVRDDLLLRGAASVGSAVLDVRSTGEHRSVIEAAHDGLGGMDLAIIAHGSLPSQQECQASYEATLGAFEVNALSVMSLLIHLSAVLEGEGGGTLVVISSVAGDRGRRSNYVYGSAKGAVSLFAQGLRSQLSGSNVRVITIKPGLVDTPMTEGLTKGLLWSEPDRIARGIVGALGGSRDVVYLPWYWRWVMLVVRLIPERIFKRLSF